MSTVGWLLVVAVGIALGFSAGRLWPGSAARVTALENERNAAREDLQNYRKDVSQHFERTAELFDKVTTDYRDLYEHLARSERQLGAIRGESTGSSLAPPEQRRLGTEAAAAATTATTPAEANAPSQAADVAAPGDETVPPVVDEDAGPEDGTAPSVADENTMPEDETAPSVAHENTVPEDEQASERADEENVVRPGK